MGSTRYVNKEGILADAKRDAISLGGQLFLPRTGDEPVTLRVGNTTYTYWPPGTIEVGGLFNAIHQALQDVYIGMQHSAQMLGQYLIRAKTDCLLVRVNCPIEIEERVVKYWQKKGFRLKCKKDLGRYRFGWSYFSPEDVDLGFIQGIPIGSTNEVRRLIEKGDIELKDTIPSEVINRWQHWLV